MSKLFKLNLQRFAEGAAVESGDSGVVSDDAGQDVTAQSDELFDTGAEEETDDNQQDDAAEEEESFEKLIKGKYKKEFGQTVSGIVQDRVKNMQTNLDKLNPVIQLMSEKYGVDAEDIDKLTEAIANDDSFYEAEAADMGVDVKTLKHIRELERKNEQFAKQIRESEQDKQNHEAWAKILEQSEKLKEVFPNFDIEEEMQNEQFGMLIAAGVDVATAFKVKHESEIQPQMMRYAAQNAEQKVANAVKSNKGRPQEGSGHSQPVRVKKDVSKLTDAERDEINRRVLAGEEIIL